MTRTRQREGSLSDAIVAALEADGVLVMRNAVAALRVRGRCYRTGLSRGSADLICVVPVRVVVVGTPVRQSDVGRLCALEVKAPGEVPTREDVVRIVAKLGPIAVAFYEQYGIGGAVKTWKSTIAKLPEAERHVLEQSAWQERVRRFGGFACFVDSVEAARAAVTRCRAGACS